MKLSEFFYSVQGEGATIGTPAYFLRLQGCNLNCVWCDTAEIWKKGEDKTFSDITDKFIKDGTLAKVNDGLVHLVWTGGEPTLPRNARDITDFLGLMKGVYQGNHIYNELETNATQESDLYKQMQQINASPKLSNSGMSSHQRVIPEAMAQIKCHPNSYFKFVIQNAEDLVEAEHTYIRPFKLDPKRIILMPEGNTPLGMPFATRMCFDLSKQTGYRTVPRAHIFAYGGKTGV